jgi:uncharacterized protein (TIRG00374 family)
VLALTFLLDVKQVAQTLQETDWRVAIATIACCQVVFMILRALRWRLMLGTGVPFFPVFHAQNIGYLITNVLPFRLGDLARAYLVGATPETKDVGIPQALSTVALERILDVLMIVILLGVALPFAPQVPDGMRTTGTLFSIVSAAGFGLMVLAAAKRSRTLQITESVLQKIRRFDTSSWQRWVESFLDGLSVLTRLWLFLPVLGLSILLWSFILLGYLSGIRGVWPEAPWFAAALAVCAAAFGISLPSSPSSLGVYHLAVIAGLSVFPIPEQDAASFAIVFHAEMVLVNVTMGLIGLWQSGRKLGRVMDAVQGLNQT